MPPSTMLFGGTSVGLEDALDKVKAPTGVSASPMVEPIADVAVSSAVIWSLMLEIVGGVSTTVTVKVQLVALPQGSVAVQVTILIPTGKVEAEGGLQSTVLSPEQLSVAVTT